MRILQAVLKKQKKSRSKRALRQNAREEHPNERPAAHLGALPSRDAFHQKKRQKEAAQE